MKVQQLTRIISTALCILHSVASPASNTTLASSAVGPNINLGTLYAGPSVGSTVAWGSGLNRCYATIIGPPQGSYCDHEVTLADMDGTFIWRGCGGRPSWVLRNNEFYGNCVPFHEDIGCDGIVETTAHCGPGI
ncbi:hypothetical protein C8R47DRAFT_1324272 [Mycena vitilis]|nr:hypothetical protein C8R47DRAFT_1324272 [Mycena vitilis]